MEKQSVFLDTDTHIILTTMYVYMYSGYGRYINPVTRSIHSSISAAQLRRSSADREQHYGKKKKKERKKLRLKDNSRPGSRDRDPFRNSNRLQDILLLINNNH